MKSILLRLTIAPAACLLVQCSALPQQDGPDVFTAQKGAYSVRFQAGPHSFQPQRSFSSYRIQRPTGSPGSQFTEAMESALRQDAPDFKAADCIRLHLSPDGEALLIEEDVPNECGPCCNWLLVRHTADGLSCAYLRPPENPRSASITGELARVVRITDAGGVVFRFASGPEETAASEKLLIKNGRPIFPG